MRFPKIEQVRSKAIIEACRELPCQHCGFDLHGHVVAAHSNWSVHGKAKSLKAGDDRVAALCDRCHVPLLDQGSHLSRAERQALWWRAHVKTVRELLRRSLWPPAIAVPDIEHCPF